MGNRLRWLFAILCAAGCYLMENNAGTLGVLACVVLLPLLGMLRLAVPPRISARWELPESGVKGTQLQGVLVVRNEGKLPLHGLELTARCRNLRTGAEETEVLTVSLLPKQQVRKTFRVSSACCGRVALSIEEASCRDLFGILRRKVELTAQRETTVLPKLFTPTLWLGEPLSDGDAGSDAKPGNDPAETVAIREYVPGDPIRRIHWKLSEKTDQLMTREFGRPIAREALLLLENGGRTAEERDAITEVFASLSRAMAENGTVHDAAWQNPRTGEPEIQTVSTPEDFARMLSSLLELPPEETGGAGSGFAHGIDGYAHVVVVGGRIPAGLPELVDRGRVSALILGGPEEMRPDGVRVYPFTPADYPRQLANLEV